MSVLTDLRTRLEDAKAKGSVPLDATTLGKPGAGIVALFSDNLGSDCVPLPASAKIDLDSAGDKLTVSGTATSPLLGIDEPVAQAVLTAADGATGSTGAPNASGDGPVLRIVLTLGTGKAWKLATTFPHLADGPLGKLRIADGAAPRLVLRSVGAEPDPYGPTEPAGLSLALPVSVEDSGPLSALAPVLALTTGQTLELKGAATASDDAEALSLRAPSGVGSVELAVAGLSAIGFADSAVVVGGGAAKDAGGSWTAAADIEVWGQVSAGGGKIPLGVAAPLGMGPWRLFVVPDQGVRLEQVLEFVPGVSLSGALPVAVRDVVGGSVDVFSMTLGQGAGAWTPRTLQVTVSSDLAWQIVPGAIELASLGAGLDVAFDGPTVTGTVTGTVTLGSGSSAVPIAVAVPVPLGEGSITVASSPNAALPGLGALTAWIGGDALAEQLPAGVGDIGSFTLFSLSATVDPSAWSLTAAGVSLGAKRWTVVPDRLQIDDITIDVSVSRTVATVVTGHIGGTFVIGDTAGVNVIAHRADAAADWELSVTASNVALPSLSDLAGLAGTDLGELLPSGIADSRFEISTLDIAANLSKAAMERIELVVSSQDAWPIVPGQLAFEQVVAGLALDWTSGTLATTGRLSAVLDLSPGGGGAALDGSDEPGALPAPEGAAPLPALVGDAGDIVQLLLSAERAADGDWTLSGTLKEPVDLVRLVQVALGQKPSTEFGSVHLDVLDATYHTKTGAYAFEVAGGWKLDLDGISLDLGADVALQREPAKTKALPATTGGDVGDEPSYDYSGQISGSLASHFGAHDLKLSVAYVFQQQDKTSFVFTLGFDGVAISCTYTTNTDGDSILSGRLTGVTLGEIIEFLVNLVDPSLHFKLPSPWDVLDKIKLDDFELVANLTKRTIGINYHVGTDLGIAKVDTIGLTFLHKGGSPTVEIEITGSFIDQSYPPERPLSWDLLNESPPATPGAGAQLLDIQTIGIGQHLALADPKATTVPAVMSDLHDIVAKAADAEKLWDIVTFDPKGGWLVGAQFTVMDTVGISLIFDDPVLYGAQITLGGPQAGSFAGLDFQVLYRKVSDDVGVYHIELKLPDVMRHLEFGEVSVTLPVIILDIYTDGGFLVDFGFPYDNDWTVCFGVEVFPFLGAGGLYLGRLTAADGGGDKVPAVTNGTLGPVIEFGFALAVGVGKEINEGPLSAGLSLTVQGVLEGVVAWFNPSDDSLPRERYYAVAGTVAIVGKVYGKVDFKVISVDVSIVASVSATLLVEVYQPIHVSLSVKVSVKASIKILFVRIHFSFSMHLDASFTIGHAEATPWVLASGGSSAGGPTARALARGETGHRRLALAPTLLARLTAPSQSLDWKPVPVLGDDPAVLDVTMMPILTVSQPAGDDAAVTIAMAPFAQTGASPQHADAHALRRPLVAEGTDPGTLPFNVLVEALLKWGMQTLTGTHSGPVTAVDLDLIYADLCSDGIAAGGFAYDNVAAFIAANMLIALRAPATGTADFSGAALPMMPPLEMSPDGQPTVDFSDTPKVSPAYQTDIAKILAKLLVNYDYDRAEDPSGSASGTVGDTTAGGDADEPISMALFGDWFLMVAKAALQAARDALGAISHAAAAADSLASLAASYYPDVAYTSRSGDTGASIAALFGITQGALEAANPSVDFSDLQPGTALQVPPPQIESEYVTVPGDTIDAIADAWETTAEALRAANPDVDWDHLADGTAVRVPVPAGLVAIADANPDVPLAAGDVPIAGLSYTVKSGDTLTSVAAQYGLDDPSGLAEANAASRTVLQPGASITLDAAGGDGIPYTVADDDTVARIAAWLLVRAGGGVGDAASANWFANAISATNSGIDTTGPLPTGTSLDVPTVEVTDHGLEQTGTTTYVTKDGDTLADIAGLFVLVDVHPDDLTDLEGQIRDRNPHIDPGTTISLPPQTRVVALGDRLGDLAARVGLTVADLALVNADAGVLAPAATLTLPAGLRWPIAADATLSSLASAVGLDTEGLVGRVGGIRGLVATGQDITVPHAREADIDDLVKLLVHGEAAGGTTGTNDIAGMASHFLLAGLRLPDPSQGPDGPVRALFDIGGQQFPAPQPIPDSYTVAFSVNGSADWIAPVEIYTVASGDTLASIAAHFGVTVAAIERLNPGIDPSSLPPTLRVPTDEVDVTLDKKTMTDQWPSTTLDPQLDPASPSRLPLAHTGPTAHGVGKPIAWAPAKPPSLPGPAAPAGGGPALWPLPGSLLRRVAAAAEDHPYALKRTPKGKPASDAVEVASYAWATWLPLAVRRVPDPDGGWLDGTYEVVGADQSSRAALLALWTYLRGTGDDVSLWLAYGQASDGAGLVSEPLDPARTAVLKANLSTETHSGPDAALMAAAGVPASTDAYATLAAPSAFLELLWQASIVGTGGFLLSYETGAGAALPSSVFASEDEATLQVVALLDAQTGKGPDRTLHPFTTGAIVGGNLDPARLDVFAEATDGSDLTSVATAPPGNVAFEAARTEPSPGDGDVDPETRTRSLFSQLGFQITGGPFDAPELTLPVGPTTDPPDPNQEADDGTWYYHRTLPVFRFAEDRPAGLPAALPAASADPYAGVAEGAKVELGFGFRDVLGNELASKPVIASLSIPVGYYDDVLGLSAWPGAVATFRIDGKPGEAVVRMGMDLGVSRYVPGVDTPFPLAVRTASAHRARYAQVFFQLRQPDVGCALTTSLDPDAEPLADGAAVKVPLSAFAMGSYVLLSSAQAVRQHEHTAADGDTLGSVADAYTLDAAQLLDANAAADASLLIDGTLEIPELYVTRSADTLDAVAQATGLSVSALLKANDTIGLSAGKALATAGRTYTTGDGETIQAIAALMATRPGELGTANTDNAGVLASGTKLTVDGVTVTVGTSDTFGSLVDAFEGHGVATTPAGIAAANANVKGVLASGKPIAVAAAPVAPDDTTGVRAHTVAKGETLAAIASAQRCTATGLALANAQATGVLAEGAEIEVRGVTVTVASGDTFATVAGKISAQGVPAGVAEVAVAVSGDASALVEGAELAITDYVVADGDTVEAVLAYSSAFDLDHLALLSGPAPADVYPSGTALVTGSHEVAPQPGDTFQALAAEGGVSLERLAAANATAALRKGAPVAIPGAASPGDVRDAAVAIPMGDDSTPTLGELATRFGTHAGSLGTANAEMPGLLRDGVEIDYPGHTVTTDPSSTLASLAAECGVDVETFTADPSVADLAGLIAAGATALGPLPTVGDRTLASLAADLGVDPVDLASVNAAIVDLLEKGQTVDVGDASARTTSHDTLGSLLRKLRRQDAGLEMADLARACGDQEGLLRVSAAVLVPPAPVAISAPLDEPRADAPFAPLRATLTIARDPGLVDPDIEHAGAVVAASSRLAPDLSSDGLEGFARSFEEALSPSRLKVAAGPKSGSRQPLWVVDFGKQGITKVAVKGADARFYALAPIDTELRSGTPEVKPYEPKTGKLGPASAKAFSAVDIDAWMRTALGAIDLMLSPEVAAAAWRLDAKAFTEIVDAKGTIAEHLRPRVAEILQAGEADPAALEDAREALYQQMLVSLATAYTTDAVIGLPVAVSSPFGPTYETDSADGFNDLADHYGVSPEAVALSLADVADILAEVTVSYDGDSYAIKPTDTLGDVAARFGVGVEALPGGLSIDTKGAGLFAASVAIDRSAMSRDIADGDTFALLGAFFATGPGLVGTNAQDTAGLLATGAEITYDGSSYKVGKGDTLRAVAGHFEVDAATLVEGSNLLGTTGLLATGATAHCLSAADPVAPRLSGQAVAQRYVTSHGDTVDDLVDYYGVTRSSLAGKLADTVASMPGLLLPGTVVKLGEHTHRIGQGDTFKSLVDPMHASDVAAVIAGVEVDAGDGLFRAGAAIPLGRAARAPEATDTLAWLAGYFATDPASLAGANSATPDIILPGTTVTYDNASYKVAEGDTLTTIAGHLGTKVSDLATAPGIVDRAGIWNPSVMLRWVQVLPALSLSTAKIPLVDGTAHTSLLLSTSADTRYKNLILDLDDIVAELELHIADVGDAPGYQASDWLRFPVPLSAESLGGAIDLQAGQLDVPIPLRSFPLMPSLKTLEASATWAAGHLPTTIAQAKQWQLASTVEHRGSAQDEMRLEVAFGRGPTTGLYATDDALFAALAQFSVAWPAMGDDVAALSALAPDDTDDRLAAMVASFSCMATALASAMPDAQRPELDAEAAATFAFRLDWTYTQGAGSTTLSTLDLTLVEGDVDEAPWPAIYLGDDRLDDDPPAGGAKRYYYPQGIPAFTALQQRYVFPESAVPTSGEPSGLDAVRWQNAQVSVSVSRNARLVATAPTSSAFVYQTPEVAFSTPAVPLIQTAARIVVDAGGDLGDAISTALDALLSHDGTPLSVEVPVRVTCRYRRRLVTALDSAAQSIGTLFPVFLAPHVTMDHGRVSDFADAAASRASAWLADQQVDATPGDEWVLDIAVYASGDDTLARPLVELSQLAVPTADAAD